MSQYSRCRPLGITALSIFFAVGSAICLITSFSLLFPTSLLEPMWRLNPRAKTGFATMGPWAIVMMGAVFAACSVAAVGLWKRRRWGYLAAVSLIAINLTADVAN